MPVLEYTRSQGQRLTYTIAYDHGEYFIRRNGILKKSVPDSITAGVNVKEAKPELMLRMAVADIETLVDMDE
ncbi:MAG: hypothetical protein ACO1N5_04260 [Noviherbaspirillum sp.]